MTADPFTLRGHWLLLPIALALVGCVMGAKVPAHTGFASKAFSGMTKTASSYAPAAVNRHLAERKPQDVGIYTIAIGAPTIRPVT